jgi:hypothetical protein
MFGFIPVALPGRSARHYRRADERNVGSATEYFWFLSIDIAH